MAKDATGASGRDYTIAIIAVVVLFAAVGGYIYLFGIPPQIKRWLEEEALEKMGENKASYLAKSAVDKIPESDQEDVKEVRAGVKNALGGGLQNPLGKFTGNAADDATKDFTGR